VVRVQDEEDVERALKCWLGLVLQLRHLVQHAQEVAGVREVVVRVHVRPPQRLPEGEGGQRRNLGNEPIDLEIPLSRVVIHPGVGVEGAEGGDGRDEHAHRVRVVAEAVHERLDVLVHPGVVGDLPRPVLELLRVGQLAAHEEVGDLEER
jgi:hypothetical protein